MSHTPDESTQMSSRVWTVPNALSVLRLVGVPVFVWLLLAHHDGAGLVVLVIAGLTDYLDGKIARRFNMESRLGALLDPLADRLYIAATVVCLAVRGILPLWVVLVLVARELFILAMAPTVRRHRLPLPPVHFIGKAATFNLLYAFPLLVLAEVGGSVEAFARPVAWAFIIWGVTLYWLAGLLYAVQVREMLNVVRRPVVVRS